MAKDLPEDRYDFKVQHDERTFAQNLVHVAAVDYDIASTVAGSHIGPDFGVCQNFPVLTFTCDSLKLTAARC